MAEDVSHKQGEAGPLHSSDAKQIRNKQDQGESSTRQGLQSRAILSSLERVTLFR